MPHLAKLFFHVVSTNLEIDLLCKDLFQLMACEKKFRQEIDDLKSQIKRMQENERKEKRKLAEEDAIKKIGKMEEKITELSKNLATQKQVHVQL